MRGQPAKVLSKTDIRATIAAATRLRYPDRNRVMVLLSVRAGLRACEIAGLTWAMVLDARGSVDEPGSLSDKGAATRMQRAAEKADVGVESGKPVDDGLGRHRTAALRADYRAISVADAPQS